MNSKDGLASSARYAAFSGEFHQSMESNTGMYISFIMHTYFMVVYALYGACVGAKVLRPLASLASIRPLEHAESFFLEPLHASFGCGTNGENVTSTMH